MVGVLWVPTCDPEDSIRHEENIYADCINELRVEYAVKLGGRLEELKRSLQARLPDEDRELILKFEEGVRKLVFPGPKVEDSLTDPIIIDNDINSKKD